MRRIKVKSKKEEKITLKKTEKRNIKGKYKILMLSGSHKKIVIIK
jgi:hypothetical protein